MNLSKTQHNAFSSYELIAMTVFRLSKLAEFMRQTFILFTSILFCVIAKAEPDNRLNLDCNMTAANHLWTQEILDNWWQASIDFLEINPEPLPNIVLFDSNCVWYLSYQQNTLPDLEKIRSSLLVADKPVPTYAGVHGSTIRLPNGANIPNDIIASAMPGPTGMKPFLVLAMPQVWSKHPKASKDPYLSIRIPTVALHEMIHTRQLANLKQQLNIIAKEFKLPSYLNDDVIENQFIDSTEYKQMYDGEVKLLYQAVLEIDQQRSFRFITEALEISQKRHEKYFVGNDSVYNRLEGLFLNMEGIAEWVRFKSYKNRKNWPSSDSEIITFLRGKNNSWSQDEGLALILLLDRIVPDWKMQILNPNMPSPFEILRAALPKTKT